MRQPGSQEPFRQITLPLRSSGIWYHVFRRGSFPDTGPLTFAKGWGNSRFSPIAHPNGRPVGTYYAASGVEAALVESVLHDVPMGEKNVIVGLDVLHDAFIARIRVKRALRLVSFQSLDLHPLGLTREAMIGSLPDAYPLTRQWAQAAFLQQPQAQGIVWTSRRDDRAKCVVLFEERMSKAALTVDDGPAPLWEEPMRSVFVALCKRMDIGIVGE